MKTDQEDQMETCARQVLESFYDRCGLDRSASDTASPVRITRFSDGSGETEDDVVTTDLTEYGLGSADWPTLSWLARSEACEWLELYHEVRVEATLLSTQHRMRFEAKLAGLDRPEPGDYPLLFYTSIFLYLSGLAPGPKAFQAAARSYIRCIPSQTV